MSAKKPDISQIQKYLNGELDARAMYELERQAQNDPFLMDVLRGMESNDQDQQPHLDAIDQMLQQRVQQSRKPVILMYKYWAAAACLLIVLGAGTLWLTRQKPQNLVAVSAPPVKPIEKPSGSAPATDAPTIMADKNAAVAKLQTRRNKTPDLLLAEPPAAATVVNAYRPDTTARIAYNKTAVTQKQTGDLNEIVAIPYNAPVGNSNVKSINAEAARTVTGKVVVKNNGEVLPGVPIKINGADQNIRTNANGMFSAPMPGKNGTIAINYRGYEPKQITVGDQDNIRIELVPTQTALAEVAIRDNVTKRTIVTNNNMISTGSLPDSTARLSEEAVVIPYGTQKRIFAHTKTANTAPGIIKGYLDYITSDVNTHPIIPYKQYQAYINERAAMPDGVTGEVELGFHVAADGSITDIRVINGTKKAINVKVIDIIKNGPKWVKGTDPKEIQLKVVFHK